VPSLFLWLGSVWAAEPVHFADPHLKAVVEETLWISDPMPEDMLGLTSLAADSKEMTNLTGLTKLGYVDLRGSPLTAEACSTYIPQIVAGDPNIPVRHEIFPNGLTIDMGAYGGTVEASKSYSLR
jgi:hypothetical protein